MPVFDSGSEAADHGQADIGSPSDEAHRAISNIMNRRTDEPT
ncbi:hypothetical protein [Nocardia cyriacigeorgica]|nr:hypothetical protein [Nocardia cyriacigeorgica]